MVTMNRSRRGEAIAALVIPLLLFSSSAAALPFSVSSRGGGSATASGGPDVSQSKDSGEVQQGSVTNAVGLSTSGTDTFMDQMFSQGASFSGTGTASLGELHGFVFARAQADSRPNPFNASVSVAEFLGWSDTFTIHSPTGDPVKLHAEILLNSSISTIGSRARSTGASADALTEIFFNGIRAAFLANDEFTPNPTATTGFFILANDGDVLTFHQNLEAVIGTGVLIADTNHPAVEGTVNASDTAAFTLNTDTPGGSYTTASGRTYFTFGQPTPVSEPATLLLVAFGVLGLVGTVRRRSCK